MTTVAIIGGGFCGTLTAVNLARLSAKPLQVRIVNCHYPLARGVAYGTTRPEHLLNVVARNMSAFPDLPTHFVDWLGTRADFAGVPLAELRESFVPRRVYGDYVQSLLFWQIHPLGGARHVQIEVVHDEVVDLVPDGRGVQVVLSSGAPFLAEQAVLATGNPRPLDLDATAALSAHPAYCANPWQGWESRLPDPQTDVLLVGTGLTMVDVFLTLRARSWQGNVYAVSRNGLLPHAHFRGSDYPDFPPDEPWTLGLRELAATIQEHCARLRGLGMHPALAVDKLRPFTQRIWRSFSLAEKLEFLERHRTPWNVLRHRIPPDVAAQLEAARRDGKLQVIKGRLGPVRAEDARIHVTIEPGDGSPPTRLTVGLLVNCTGPRESFAEAQEPLLRNLSRRGMIQPDELDMGIAVSPDFAVVNQEGQPSSSLFALGPLLKGTLWETIAVPELRAQAHQLATVLLANKVDRTLDWAPETPPDLVEYYI